MAEVTQQADDRAPTRTSQRASSRRSRVMRWGDSQGGRTRQGEPTVSDPPDGVEVVNPRVRRGPFRAAVFDFDGTVSLIREGWAGIMADLGLDLLRAQGVPGDRAELEGQMLRLSGKPSIFQMR